MAARRRDRLVLWLVIALSTCALVSAADIHLNPPTNEKLKGLGAELGRYLHEITGDAWGVSAAPYAGKGALLALRQNYGGRLRPFSGKKAGKEAVWLKGTGKGIAIIGNSELAVQHGMFIYLEKLGYRQFFPGRRWTIIPKRKSGFLKLDLAESPS